MKDKYCAAEVLESDERLPVWNLTEKYMDQMQQFTEWSRALQR